MSTTVRNNGNGPDTTEGDRYFCSFCAKPQQAVKRLIAGPGKGVFICDECVIRCHHIITGDHTNALLPTKPRTPHEMFKLLQEYVVGQEQAKRVVSVGVYNHYKKILADTAKAN